MTLRPSSELPIYAKLAFVSCVWGGTFVAGRGISSELPPLMLASLRFLLAGTVLLIILASSRKGFVRITRAQAFKILILGFFGVFVYNICFFYGLRLTDASRASLIVAINPAVIAAFGFIFFRDRLTTWQIAGLALCLIGAAVVITSRAPHALATTGGHAIGDMLIMGCVVSWVIYSVFCRDLIKEIGALETATYSVVTGAVMLTFTAVVTGQMAEFTPDTLSWRSIAGLIYLGLFGSALAYVLYYDGIAKIGPTRAGTFIALNPLTSVLAGVALLGERLTGQTILGGGLIITGIIISNVRIKLWRSARKPVPT